MKYIFHILLAFLLVPSALPAQGDVWTLISTTAEISPGSRPVNAILPDPRAPDTLYVGTDQGLLKVRASTGDTSAAGFGTSIPAQGIFELISNPSNPQILYAGTSNDGIYKTVDGSTWTKLPGQPSEMNTIHAIAIDPQDTTLMYAGTLTSGLFRSTDSGASWSVFNRRDSTFTGGSPDSLSNVYFIANHPTSLDTVVFAGTLTDGVFRNQGGTANWVPISNGLPTGPSDALRGMLINPADGDVLYAGVAANGFYKSTDGGNNWVKKQGGISDTSDVLSLAQASSNPEFLYGGTLSEEVFRSTVGAEIWDPIASLPSGLTSRAMAVDPIQVNRAYSGTFNGVYRIDVTSASQVTYGVGKNPIAIVSANLDTQALVDLAVVNGDDNTVSVMINQVGGFFIRKDVPVGGDPRSIVAGDVDEDGNPDLVVGNRVGQSVTILRNDGFGGFSFFLDLFVGHPIESVAVTDLDGDTDLDLLTANDNVNTISVFLNGGRGTFFPLQEHAVGAGPRSITAKDFNGDGRPDLAVATQTGNGVSILINQGGGLFDPDAPVAVSGGPVAVAVEDFDQDGNYDLAVVPGGVNAVGLLLGRGDGTFEAPVLNTFSSNPVDVSVSDLDADRYPDLAVALPTTVESLINDGTGKLGAGPNQGSLTGIDRVETADYDGDGRPDAVAVSSGADAVVLFQNVLSASIKPPAPPRNLTASDTPADLGGRITLTWEQPRVDEETDRTATYEVFRSDANDGVYTRIVTVSTSDPFVSRDSTIVTRSGVDSTATLGVPFFYYVTAEDNFGVASAPSAIATATSIVQPFFNFEFSDLGIYSVGDTVSVRVTLDPLSFALSGISLFLDFDSTAVTVLDGIPEEAGLQPFALNTDLLSGGMQVLENKVVADTTGMINLSVGSLSLSDGLTLEIGTISFATAKDTVTTLAISNDVANNRRTVLINSADGSAISPNLPQQAATLVVQNYRIKGGVGFQGRTTDLDLDVRVDLRKTDGLPLSTAYTPANDQDKNREGIQLTLDEGGEFSLIQVPAGTYAAYVKAFHYLRGRVTGDSLTVGPDTTLSTISFQWVSSAGAVFNELRGGDADNDNNVNLADFGLLAEHFATINITDSSDPAWVADFNADSTVNLADFSILSSNFGEQGLGLGFSTKPPPPLAGLNLVPEADGGFLITVEGIAEVKGFSIELAYDSEDFSVSVDPLAEGSLTRSQGVSMWWIVKPVVGGLRLAGYVKGDCPIKLDGEGEIALLRLNRKGDGIPDLLTAWVADGNGTLLPALGEVGGVLLRDASLFQNVPNPFNPATTIAYDVPDGPGGGILPVSLQIFNLTGHVIRTLVDVPQPAGHYRVEWDGRDFLGRSVASGVYFYRLETGTFRGVRRMLLLR